MYSRVGKTQTLQNTFGQGRMNVINKINKSGNKWILRNQTNKATTKFQA